MRRLLEPHVHAAQVRDDLVFLDVEADAYFCLEAAAPVLTLSADRRSVEGPASALADLEAAGLLHKGGRAGRTGLALTAPTPRDEHLRRLWRPQARISARGCRSLAATAWQARRDVRDRSFAELVGRAQAQPVAAVAPPTLAVACASFEALRPFIPFDGDCLFRSYWQLLFLKALGQDGVRWVFGVRTFPFFAHCWLQVGDQVLNDDPDVLVGYRQIMVI